MSLPTTNPLCSISKARQAVIAPAQQLCVQSCMIGLFVLQGQKQSANSVDKLWLHKLLIIGTPMKALRVATRVFERKLWSHQVCVAFLQAKSYWIWAPCEQRWLTILPNTGCNQQLTVWCHWLAHILCTFTCFDADNVYWHSVSRFDEPLSVSWASTETCLHRCGSYSHMQTTLPY